MNVQDKPVEDPKVENVPPHHSTFLGMTISQIIIGSFIFGMTPFVVFLVYTQKFRVLFFTDKIQRNILIRDIQKELVKEDLLLELSSCKFLNKLGNGQFGHVFAARVTQTGIQDVTISDVKNKLNNCSVAIKQLKSGMFFLGRFQIFS